MDSKDILLEVGKQVAYMPDHAKENFDHRAVLSGFIAKIEENPDRLFIRYWLPFEYWNKSHIARKHWADKPFLKWFFQEKIRTHNIRQACYRECCEQHHVRIPTLRTTANSELTPVRLLRFGTDYVPQKYVDQALYELGYTDKKGRVL